MEHGGAQGPSWVRPLHPGLLIPPTRGHPPWAVNAARTLSPGVAGLAPWSLKGAGVGWAFFHQLVQLGPALGDAAFCSTAHKPRQRKDACKALGSFYHPQLENQGLPQGRKEKREGRLGNVIRRLLVSPTICSHSQLGPQVAGWATVAPGDCGYTRFLCASPQSCGSGD